MAGLHRALFAAAALGLVGACDVRSGGPLSYTGPDAPGTGPVSLGTQPPGDAVTAVTARLRAAGLDVLSVDPDAGTIRVGTGSDALVDCGTLTQRIDGRVAEIPGTAPSAVLFAFDQPGDILVREARVRSTATIRIASGGTTTATIAEAHAVTLSQSSPATGRTLWRESLEFTGTASARFADGTRCTSSGALRGIVSG
jgi:hypothetical protein